MEELKLTRNQMANLLHAINGDSSQTIIDVLREACSDGNDGDQLSVYISTSLPQVYLKLMKTRKKEIGLSINEIVGLGNAIEYSTFSATAVQNWVKRDIKGLIGSPRVGRKYAVDQAAMLFIVEDLKSVLDFDSIRRLLRLVFNNPEDHEDDLVNPIDLYAAYSSVFEALDQNDDEVLDVDFRVHRGEAVQTLVKQKADECVAQMPVRDGRDAEAVSHMIVVAALAVQTSYFQSLARGFMNAVLLVREEE